MSQTVKAVRRRAVSRSAGWLYGWSRRRPAGVRFAAWVEGQS